MGRKTAGEPRTQTINMDADGKRGGGRKKKKSWNSHFRLRGAPLKAMK